MHIDIFNTIMFVAGLVFGLVFAHVWYLGTRAAMYGGLSWQKAIVHVLFFMLMAVPAMLLGWTWWFISYGFFKGRQAADGGQRRE